MCVTKAVLFLAVLAGVVRSLRTVKRPRSVAHHSDDWISEEIQQFSIGPAALHAAFNEEPRNASLGGVSAASAAAAVPRQPLPRAPAVPRPLGVQSSIDGASAASSGSAGSFTTGQAVRGGPREANSGSSHGASASSPARVAGQTWPPEAFASALSLDESGDACILSDSQVLGCRRNGCQCNTFQHCYPKIRFLEDGVAGNSLPFDIGVCWFSMPVMLVFAILVFLAAGTICVVMRACILAYGAPEERSYEDLQVDK